MNEAMSYTDPISDCLQWIQRSYIEVPGDQSVESDVLYNKYQQDMTKQGYALESLLPKKKVGKLVGSIFRNVSLKYGYGQGYGQCVFRRLRLSFDYDELRQTVTQNKIASDYGFIHLMETRLCTLYAYPSGYSVNNSELLKYVSVLNDNTVQIIIGDKPVELANIGLSNFKAETVVDTRILFNTVRQSKVCCGQPVSTKLYARNRGLLQEWKKNGDEKIKLRLTSSKCLRVIPFSSQLLCLACQTRKQ